MPYGQYRYTALDWNQFDDLHPDDLHTKLLTHPDHRYFFESCIKIPVQGGKSGGSAPFHLFPWMHEVIQDGISSRELFFKAREIGSSTLWVAEFLLRVLQDPGANLLIAGNKQETARSLLGYARHMVSNLPDVYKPGIVKSNTDEIVLDFGTLGRSSIKALPCTEDAGRSERSKYLLCTEVAFWGEEGNVDPDAYWTSVEGTLVPGGYHVVESTANTSVDRFHHMWYDDTNGFTKRFYGRYANPSHTPDWEQQKRSSSPTLYFFLRDNPENPDEAFVTSSDTYFSKELITQLSYDIRPPIETRPIHQSNGELGSIKLWKKPVANSHYVFGVDPSEGRTSGGRNPDFSAGKILDWRTKEQVASFKCRLTEADLTPLIISLAQEYNNAHLAIESNSAGYAVIRGVQEHGYKNLYYRTVKTEGHITSTVHRDPGWVTTRNSKSVMLSDLQLSLQSRDMVIHEDSLLDQLRTIDRIDMRAQKGGNDDEVMALAITLQAAKSYNPASATYEPTDVERYTAPSSWRQHNLPWQRSGLIIARR